MKKTIKLFISLFGFLIICQGTNAQWVSNTNLPSTFSGSLAIDACDSKTIIFSAPQDAGIPESIFLSIDGGNNWKDISPLTEWGENAFDISMVDKDNIWLVTTGQNSARIFHTSNSGETWEVQFDDSSVTTFFNYIEMFDLNNGIAMGDDKNFGSDPAIFLKTVDGGKNWISQNNTSFGGMSGSTFRRLDFVSSEIGYFYETGFVTDRKLFKTLNGGKDWEATNYIGTAQNIKFYNKSFGLIYRIVYQNNLIVGGIISRTIDAGKTWKDVQIESSRSGGDIEFLPNDASKVWFTDHKNLFFSSDSGKTWFKQNVPNGDLNGIDIVFVDEKNGWIITNDGLLFRTNNNGGLLTNVEEIEAEEIPNEIKLYQNYPNPFNPVTTIKYSVPFVGASHDLPAQLKVYDVIGNEIATLVNEQKSTGNYEVKFDASNLSSGIYYYQLTTGDFIKTNKMVYLK